MRAELRHELIVAALALALVFAVFAIVRHAHGAERMLCHLEPLTPDWHYRTKIHPRPDVRCWYDGPRMLPRARLYWAETPEVPPISIISPEPNEDASIWNLIERWRGEYQRGGAAPGWQHKE